ncbi:Protein SQS1 [Colletotrichum sp. SAR 10_86]|nr:Protein SQS1 [Colletotrichum sp. SAR 10_75]KAI8194035.1 Protein SQS1 [Colletotrichum sp. SAR 10_65]KAI8209622.1 Protein SQS1 [Colletotrichum sp. SAR 10_76]KAI8217477.1 Protein SQS1 [Colletotrichum sp. SAR 10_86]KAJ4995846.1 Protein SQS1 [Colletotrichum sp. SAR 10_66]
MDDYGAPRWSSFDRLNMPHLNPPAPVLSISGSTTRFTLQDEARSTAHRSSPWSADTRLRHQPVKFVSTGSIEPLKQLEKEILHKAEAAQFENKAHDKLILQSRDNATQLHETNGTSPGIDNETSMATSTDETDPDATARPDLEIDSAPKPPEQASESLPYFLDVTGDRDLQHNVAFGVEFRCASPAASDSSEEVILFKGRNKAAPEASGGIEKPFNLHGICTEITAMEQTVLPSNSDTEGSADDSFSLERKQPRGARAAKRLADEDLIADYIANMREHGDGEGLLPADAYSRRDLGGSLSEFESIDGSLDTLAAQQANSLSDDSSEAQIATDADGLNDDRIADHALKDHQAGKGKVACGNNAVRDSLHTDLPNLGSFDASHGEEAILPSEISDQEDDEDDLFRSAADRFAGEIDDFDFMDWDRPALKRKGKGAKNRIPVFDISDSELEEKMLAAWKNDRTKKAERKRERQALRAQGLLGKNVNPEDLRVKYPHGMGLDQIADELRTFLLGTNTILTLPPMDNHARKVIHELASKFNIKSKSTGSGDQRRPMLHRTFRTAKFAEEVFDAAIARVGRKYFPRNDTTLRAAVQRQSARRGGGGGHAGVIYRDGEVVGGSAPELGQENKGRAMLEKMGWSSGTALGALNNKGILQPVAHIVKRSKAGLG